MRAATYRQHGGPEVLEIADVPTPTPGPHEVQVRVTATALNHIDVWMRRGLPALHLKLPHVSGGDVCGVVSALGQGVTGVAEGDRVVLNPGMSCGHCPACLGGRDQFCPDFRMLGEQTWGGQAEYVVVPQANLVPVPREKVALSDEQLAAVPIAFITAWQMLVDRAQIRQGETVLVLAAGSGVGSAAIQIAKLWGARVITTASTDEKLAAARALGADDTINHTKTEIVAEVKRLTGRRGADIVVEHVGASTFPKSIVAAAKGGRIVTCGATDGFEPVLNLRHVFWRQLSILGSTLASKQRLFEIIDLMGAGRLEPVVHTVLPLEQIAEGHRLIESRAAFGKVVLRV
ncbi:MAG TPA: zinc-binding dehydrogenase [Polyangia bacterium]|jgi:NADPH:quinone reductase-like Zn-dependent oxidoreductase|nr:zinc-binding dehydrogenase [Polyangia bacterium]